MGNGQFVAVAAIFLFSILTFNILFDASSPDDYPREVLAALIGTIMAAVVTTLLLNQQSVGEELKERNVEVFRKKIAAYENFIDRSLLHAEDGLSDDEVRELRRSIYSMALVSSADTVGVLIDYVRTHHVGDRDGEIADVIGAFRKELGLDQLESSTLDDLLAIEAKLAGEVDAPRVRIAAAALDRIAKRISAAIESTAPGLLEDAEFSEPFGQENGTAIILILPSGMTCYLWTPYQSVDPSLVDGQIDFEDVPQRLKKSVRAALARLPLQLDPGEPDSAVFALAVAADDRADDRARALTPEGLANALVELELAAKGRAT